MEQLNLQVGDITLVAQVGQYDGKHFVAIKPLCEALGIDPWKQQKKITSDPKFNYRAMAVVASDNKNREMVCIPVDEIGIWLCGINSRRVSPEVQGPLLQFQKMLQVVIHDALCGHITPQQFALMVEQISAMTDQIKYLLGRIQQLEQGIVPAHNDYVSAPAKALRRGHMRIVN